MAEAAAVHTFSLRWPDFSGVSHCDCCPLCQSVHTARQMAPSAFLSSRKTVVCTMKERERDVLGMMCCVMCFFALLNGCRSFFLLFCINLAAHNCPSERHVCVSACSFAFFGVELCARPTGHFSGTSGTWCPLCVRFSRWWTQRLVSVQFAVCTNWHILPSFTLHLVAISSLIIDTASTNTHTLSASILVCKHYSLADIVLFSLSIVVFHCLSLSVTLLCVRLLLLPLVMKV